MKRTRRKARHYPHEETWFREFLGYHGTDGVTRFVESDLGGVSLTQVVEALTCGSVIAAEKCDDQPGTVCVVQYATEEGDLILVTVHFVSNEEELRILSAATGKESDSEPDRAA